MPIWKITYAGGEVFWIHAPTQTEAATEFGRVRPGQVSFIKRIEEVMQPEMPAARARRDE